MNSGSSPGFRSGYVSLLGPANAGKSTLVNALVGTKVSIVSPKPQTTRDKVLGIVNSPASQIIFIDTPGFFPAGTASKFAKKALAKHLANSYRSAAEEGDVTLLVVDALKCVRKGDRLRELEQFWDKEGFKNPDIIAVNKTDLVPGPELLPLFEELYSRFFEKKKLDIVPISALRKKGLDDLLGQILTRLPEGPKYYEDDTRSNSSDDFFIAELIREKAFHELAAELPYSTAVVVERIEEKGTLLHIDASILVERESQKGIVVGKGGAQLKSIGTKARVDLEKAYGMQVMLKLHVRLQSNWTMTDNGMHQAGYEREY